MFTIYLQILLVTFTIKVVTHRTQETKQSFVMTKVPLV